MNVTFGTSRVNQRSKDLAPTITGIDAFTRSPGQAAIATHKYGVADAEKVESLPLYLDPSLDRPDPSLNRQAREK